MYNQLFRPYVKHPQQYVPTYYSVATYSQMLDCDYRTLLRNVGFGNIQPQAILSTGEYLFSGERLGEDRQVVSPLCRVKRS